MHLGGHHLDLDVSTFAHNERTLFLYLISQLCANVDGSHSKTLHKSFFIEAHSMIETSKRIEIDKHDKVTNGILDLSGIGQ